MSELNVNLSGFLDLVNSVECDVMSNYKLEDLTHQQMHNLQIIYKLSNPTITELAKVLNLKKSTVTILVDKLMQKGYVKKVQSDCDRRCTHVHIDDKGMVLIDVHDVLSKELEDIVFGKLTTTECVIFSELIKKIVR